MPEGTARREAASDAASDAALLATPLYRPPSPDVAVHETLSDPPRPPDPRSPAAPDARPEPPAATVADDPARVDDRPAALPPTRTVRDVEPLVEMPQGSAAPVAASTQPAEAAPSPTPAPAPPPPAKPLAGPRPGPALPTSDLENLDEGRRSEAHRHGDSESHPWTWLSLIGGLALLSLVGTRRRR